MKASALPQDLRNIKLLRKKLPKRVRMDKDFAGIKAGSMWFVGTPQIIDAYLRAIALGQTQSIECIGPDLVRQNQCGATYPVSTAIFLRICAQASIEHMDAGIAPTALCQFWRVINPVYPLSPTNCR